jgi:hypothetical protein
MASCAAEPLSAAPLPQETTLHGCPNASAGTQLSRASLPFLGVSCRVPNSIACDRVGIGVRLDRPATLVTVQLAGRLISLTPPSDPPDSLWLGYLSNAGLRRGPLDVHVAAGTTLWFGNPSVYARVGVNAFFPNGTVATLTATDFLHPGFG